ncbi:hypothetical protein K438DRAFT_1746841 [Mycena galopus ATCC 62051]|nr:hypothetical protein K438DRAFT_1746841 [Mycena galopus ATCC 62051]
MAVTKLLPRKELKIGRVQWRLGTEIKDVLILWGKKLNAKVSRRHLIVFAIPFPDPSLSRKIPAHRSTTDSHGGVRRHRASDRGRREEKEGKKKHESTMQSGQACARGHVMSDLKPDRPKGSMNDERNTALQQRSPSAASSSERTGPPIGPGGPVHTQIFQFDSQIFQFNFQIF